MKIIKTVLVKIIAALFYTGVLFMICFFIVLLGYHNGLWEYVSYDHHVHLMVKLLIPCAVIGIPAGIIAGLPGN